MIDIHCHLAFPGLNEIKDKVINEAKKSMDAIITCGLSRDFEKTLEVSGKYSGFVYATLGIHPEDIINMTDDEMEKNLEFIRNHSDDIVAIGEIGLDGHLQLDSKSKERTEVVFMRLLQLSNELDIPVILHSRKAEDEVLNAVLEEKIKSAVFHCYTGNMTIANRIIENGYHISLATNISNSKNCTKIARRFPLERLMSETDSPFLSPIKGKLNIPSNVRYVIERIAEERNMEFEVVETEIDKNIANFFNLDI